MLAFKIQQHPKLIMLIAPIRLMGVEQLIDVFEVEIAAPEAAAIFSRSLRRTFDDLCRTVMKVTSYPRKE